VSNNCQSCKILWPLSP